MNAQEGQAGRSGSYNQQQKGGINKPNNDEKKKKRDPILDLSKYTNKKICVKFMGGRESKYYKLDIHILNAAILARWKSLIVFYHSILLSNE